MDYKKDINQTGLISQKNSTGVEAFSITLSKKCERLATAIYLVTSFLSDTEPLKFRLRALSLDFVKDAAAVKGGGVATETTVLDALRGNVGETLALLELAFIAGLISEMNFTILKREYKSLRDTVDIKKASRESRTDTILGDTFFGTSFHNEERSLDKVVLPKVMPTQNEAPVSFRLSDRKKTESTLRVKNLGSGSTLRDKSEPVVSNRATTDVAKESRRTRILKLIKDNREVAIKDIVAYFPDLSEKTIQRELVAMSDSGVLKKSGERRWSRYSVSQG